MKLHHHWNYSRVSSLILFVLKAKLKYRNLFQCYVRHKRTSLFKFEPSSLSIVKMLKELCLFFSVVLQT